MQAHGLAIRTDNKKIVPEAERFGVHLGNYQCVCGRVSYRIFADFSHADEGERFAKYISLLLARVHERNEEHPDMIEIPMAAEFTT